MRFSHFRLPFRPSLVRLYKRHPRGESEEIFDWVLLMAQARKFSLGCPLKKTCKTSKPGVCNLCSQGANGQR
jgi:hypothetical protein